MPNDESNIVEDKSKGGNEPQEIPSFLKGDSSVSNTSSSDNADFDTEVLEGEVIDEKSADVSEVENAKVEEAPYDDLLEEASSPGLLGRIDELLVELNLERKHFFMLFGFFAVLLVGIILSFVFVFSLFSNEPDSIVAEDKPVKVVEVKKEKPEKNGDGIFKNSKFN
jgi:hypothetical protein